MSTENEQLSNKSEDLGEFNRELFLKTFPMCVTEDGGVDFVRLRTLLGDLVDNEKEGFGLRWRGRNAAIQLSLSPSHCTLSPDHAESFHFGETKNLMVVGDNLEALKLLRKHYQGRVKMVYVDPPYNTGTDFVYRDDFAETKQDYLRVTNQIDTEGRVLSTNADTSGRIHSKWLSMIYPRIALSHKLLAEDGLIFVSIDDNELDHLFALCSQVFGRANFIGTIVVEGTPKNDPDVISTAHEYCLCFAKDLSAARLAEYGLPNVHLTQLDELFKEHQSSHTELRKLLDKFLEELPDEADNIRNYKHFDDRGIYRIGPIDDPQGTGPQDQRLNPRTGNYCKVPKSGWRCNLAKWNEWVKDGLIWFPETDDQLPAKKTYALATRREPLRALQKMQIRKDTEYLRKLFDTSVSVFANPKPTELIMQLLNLISDSDPVIVLDLFAGSGTLADSAMRLNSLAGKQIQVISVQIAEVIDPSSTSSKKERQRAEEAIRFLQSIGKPPNIAEITKERLRRAGREVSEVSATTDVGFRCLVIRDSNIEAWDAKKASETADSLLAELKENRLKPGCSDEDVMFEVMVKYGVDLSSTIERVPLGKGFFWDVGNGQLLVVTSKGLAKDDFHTLAKRKPKAVVVLDEAFEPESLKANARATFKDAKIELKTF
jgi:adenine-specific DNA-methyltransferase